MSRPSPGFTTLPIIDWECLSCGCAIRLIQTPTVTDAVMMLDTTVEHRGPMTDACRVIFEALAGEQRALVQARLRSLSEPGRQQHP